MNRFVIGGILAAAVLLLTGSFNRLFGDRAREPRPTDAQNTSEVSDLGSLPIEQAGQLVRRQSDLGAGGMPTTSDAAFSDGQAPEGMPPGGRSTISPTTNGTSGFTDNGTGNVIPRTTGSGAATTFPANTGDIAPIQPNLVQPDASQQRPGTDPDLDSIPALW